MRLLLSNDDGYLAPGLNELADCLGEDHDVFVVAPERDHSGASNSLTLVNPIRVRQAKNGFYFVDGTPTDSVHVALTGLLDDAPDLDLPAGNYILTLQNRETFRHSNLGFIVRE